jgi:hypothetical protein
MPSRRARSLVASQSAVEIGVASLFRWKSVSVEIGVASLFGGESVSLLFSGAGNRSADLIEVPLSSLSERLARQPEHTQTGKSR